MGYAHSLNTDISRTLEAAVTSAPPAQVVNTEIIVTREDARVLKGARTVIQSNKFIIDSVEVEIFVNSNSTESTTQGTHGVTVSELVNALHYLEIKPDRIIQFLQTAVNAGLIKGKLFLK